MGAKPRDNRIGVVASPANPIVAPYADPAPMNAGPAIVPTVNTTVMKVPIVPMMQDVRDVPVIVGFDFRKRIYFGC